MEIIDKIEAKVKSAIQKIEQLEMRILELEEEKKEGEEKLQSILKALGPVELENEMDAEPLDTGSGESVDTESSGTETEPSEADESDSEVSTHDSDNLYSEEQRHNF